MSREEREAVREALLKCGSLESLLQELARSESEESRKRRQEIENGPLHPSDEDLYHYVLGWLKDSQEDEILDHLLLCRVCLEEVFRIRRIEDSVKEHLLEWADRKSLFERLKSLVPREAFAMFLGFPGLEAARHPGGPTEVPRCNAGDKLHISVEAPQDGYVTVLRCHEKADKVRLIFPLAADEDARVDQGGEYEILIDVQGPAGIHEIRAIWTCDQILDPKSRNLEDESERKRALHEFLSALEELDEGQWRSATKVYEVVEA